MIDGCEAIYNDDREGDHKILSFNKDFSDGRMNGVRRESEIHVKQCEIG